MDGQNDSSCESDLSDGWTVLNASISEHDTLNRINMNTNPGEISDAESLEVMEIERGDPALPGSHVEDLIRSTDTDTDGISVISESDGSCIPEMMDTIVVLPPKQKKYVHNYNPCINMWLSLMLAISLAITVGLGLGHYLGSARSMKAAELIQQLRKENIALEEQLTDVFTQNEHYRKELDNALNKLNQASNQCSISDELYCRSYYDETLDKEASVMGPIVSTDRVHDSTNIVVNSTAADGKFSNEGYSSSAVKPGIIESSSANDHTFGSLISDIYKLSSENVKDTFKDMLSPSSEGYKMLAGLKEKAVNMQRVLGKWSHFLVENVKIRQPKEESTVKNNENTNKENVASEFSKNYWKLVQEKCEQVVLPLSSRNDASESCNTLKNKIFSLTEPFYRFKSKFEEIIKSDILRRKEEVDKKFVSVESSKNNNPDGNSVKNSCGSEDVELKPSSNHDNSPEEAVKSQGEPRDRVVQTSEHNSVYSFQNDVADSSLKNEKYKDGHVHDTKYIYYYDGDDNDGDDDNADDVDDDDVDDDDVDDDDDDEDDDDDDDDDDYYDDDDDDVDDFNYYRKKYKHYDTQKGKKDLKNSKYYKQYARYEKRPKQEIYKSAKYGKHSGKKKLKTEKKENFNKKEDFDNPSKRPKYFKGMTSRYGKNEEYETKYVHPEKYQFNKNNEDFKQTKNTPLKIYDTDKKPLNETGFWLMNIFAGRAEHRKESHRSDWLFDRAKYRQSKREKESKSHWYFLRAHNRHQCRTHPRPDWCAFYDQNAPEENKKKEDWRRHNERDRNVDDDDKNHREYHSKPQKDWKFKHIPKYWKGGRRIISQAFMAASKFLKS